MVIKKHYVVRGLFCRSIIIILLGVDYIFQGLLQKAELLLEQGDYDNALSHFQKGARMRPDKDDFQDGIERAKHGR